MKRPGAKRLHGAARDPVWTRIRARAAEIPDDRFIGIVDDQYGTPHVVYQSASSGAVLAESSNGSIRRVTLNSAEGSRLYWHGGRR